MMFSNISKKKVSIFLVIGILLIGNTVTQSKEYNENIEIAELNSQNSENDESSQDKKRKSK